MLSDLFRHLLFYAIIKPLSIGKNSVRTLLTNHKVFAKIIYSEAESILKIEKGGRYNGILKITGCRIDKKCKEKGKRGGKKEERERKRKTGSLEKR